MDILVVEDVRADFLLIQRHLLQRGVASRCHWVSDQAGIDAALTTQRWGVILSDYSIPGLHFLDLLVKFQEAQPDVPVILVSGSVGEETAVDLLKQGLWDFVLKDNLIRLVPIIDRSLREAWGRVARRQAEARLRMVDTAMNAAANAVMITDPRGSIEWINAASAALIGFTLDEVQGKNPRFLRSGLEPADTYVHLWETIASGRTWRGELINRRKDGEVYTQYTTITPVRDHTGALRHFVSVAEDITIRKLMETALTESQQALRSHKEHLEEVVAARTAEAERLSRVKSDFLANMSHEIRTPLNAILGHAQIGWIQSDGTRDRATYTRILGSGRHLLGVLDDILDVSKIEAGMLHLAEEPVELARLVRETMEMMDANARAAGIGLRLELGPGLPGWVRGDALRMSQVLVNLLSNAVKFTERGSVTFTVESADGLTRAEGLRLRVTDTGIGMTDEQLGRLFLPFEQADTSTTRRFGGTGLGMAITRRLVELMKGSIEVRSTFGVGSTVTVHLPLDEVNPPTAALAEPPPAASDDEPPVEVAPPVEEMPPAGTPYRASNRLQGIRVLGAEDNMANRLLLGEMLRLEGAQLTLAEDGAAAFAVLEREGEQAFDLVLTDIQMPVMDGHTLARKIRTFAPTLPVIGLTAHAMDEERLRCLASGMVAHLSKPIDMRVLVSTVRSYARSRASTPPPGAPPTQV
ncbi:MAG: response regulator [Myxococcota bacterium]